MESRHRIGDLYALYAGYPLFWKAAEDAPGTAAIRSSVQMASRLVCIGTVR